MKSPLALAGLLGSTLLVSAAPAPAPIPTPVQASTNEEPCALFGEQLASATGPLPTGQPETLLACLQSVPIDNKSAEGYVQYLLNFVPFQSTLGYLKKPPSGYPFPALDLVDGLNNIMNNVKSSGYSNEYDFERDIADLFTGAYDGHLTVKPMLIGSFFSLRPQLVSISDNGANVPKVFFLSDINTTDTSYTPSAITQISGIDVDTYLMTVPESLQDKDALYNSVFANPATFFTGQGGGFSSSFIRDYNNTNTITFANGSSVDIPVGAISAISFKGIESGEDLYNNWVVASSQNNQKKKKKRSDDENLPVSSLSLSGSILPTAAPTRTRSVSSASATAAALPILGYPSQVAAADDQSIAGYYLDSHPDTAVLNIIGFITGKQEDLGLSFSSTVSKFLADCSSAKKTKLIIDVRGNPGGTFMTGFDTFKQIFPTMQIYNSARMRYHTAMNAIGTVFSLYEPVTISDIEILDQLPDDSEGEQYAALLEADTSLFNAQNTLKTPDGQGYETWTALSGPVTANGDQFSNDFSINFANEAWDLQFDSGFVLSGYGNNTNLPAQVFNSKDITIITDGQCSSTCTLFVNLMTKFGSVSTVALGGQPSTNPMAMIGGVEGANDQDFNTLAEWAQIAGETADKVGASLTDDEVTALEALTEASPLAFGVPPSLNFLDSIYSGSDTPMQFRPANADCRIFYTAADVVNITNTWNKIASGNFTCVDGGSKPGNGAKKSSANLYAPLSLAWTLAFTVFSAMLLL